MTKTEFLIVGQGISGTFLSWYLHKANRSFIVVDQYDSSSSSQVAAGIINPVTGRRIVRTWMIETLMPFAIQAYREIGDKLGIQAITQKQIIDFFPSAQMRMAFLDRIGQEKDYLAMADDESLYYPAFNYELGYGIVKESYLVNMKELLATWRQFLISKECLIERRFSGEQLSIDADGSCSWEDISAEKVIFCDGIYSSTNKYFKTLPFALNKGEALIIQSDSIPEDCIYKKSMTLVPMGGGHFWVGSSHEWNFIDNQPSAEFRERTEAVLSHWLKGSFQVVDHVAAIRPATVERRPFVGMHPHHPLVGILNGMGTKGCSLAPYFAHQLADHLTHGAPILPEADVKRFSRILQSPT